MCIVHLSLGPNARDARLVRILPFARNWIFVTQHDGLARSPENCEFRNSRFANGDGLNVNLLRRGLLELWAMFVVAGAVGFLGPFGTYLEAELPARVWTWWLHLMGAYLMVRPAILLWDYVARATLLPRNIILIWGVGLTSLPLALVWKWSVDALFDRLDGLPEILPFALLSTLAVLGAASWARRADEHFVGRGNAVVPTTAVSGAQAAEQADDPAEEPASASGPRLRARLGRQFDGPVLALQSEDHYVRVHGASGSELLLMRLRDAIAEMDAIPGEQIHRSWWVAREAIVSLQYDGRAHSLRLANGQLVPVARGSVARLRNAGFLPAPA